MEISGTSNVPMLAHRPPCVHAPYLMLVHFKQMVSCEFAQAAERQCEGSLPRREQSERGASLRAWTHLLFMTHRKSFCMSSR